MHVADVVDDWLQKRIQKNTSKIIWYETPQFLTSDSEVAYVLGNTSAIFNMTSMYGREKRLDVLVKDNKPIGGKWSFDADNREKLPKDLYVPTNTYSREIYMLMRAIDYVKKYFGIHTEKLIHFGIRQHMKKQRVKILRFLETQVCTVWSLRRCYIN